MNRATRCCQHLCPHQPGAQQQKLHEKMETSKSKDATISKELQQIINSEIKLKDNREFKKARKLYTEWLIMTNGGKSDVFNMDANQFENENLKKDIGLAFNNRGQIKYLEVDFEGAVEDYDKALEFDPNLSSSYYNRGTIFYRMGYFPKAAKDLSKAIKISPENKEFKIGFEKCKLELDNDN